MRGRGEKNNWNDQLVALQDREGKLSKELSESRDAEARASIFHNLEAVREEIKDLQDTIRDSGSASLGLGDHTRKSSRGRR